MGCCSIRAQVRHAAPVVFPVDFVGGKHVYRVHPINFELVTDPNPRKNMDVILVQKVWTNTSHVTSCIVMLKDVIKVSLLQKGQNDRIQNIVSVFYGIQCIDVLVKIQIFRMANCLLLLTAQLITAGDLNA